ncbi:MAG: DUF4331 family protein [Gemmatimonadetes bacterium]|nr:DUF4331 family protein [Gemmatimonadota bacterium]
MRSTLKSRRGQQVAAVAAVAGLVALAAVTGTIASDHQDTPEVELSPRMDINDIYAFPGSSDDRIVLVMTTSSPITPGQSSGAVFDPNLLYQFKIDNSGDARADRVIQVTFRGRGNDQTVEVRGPMAPNEQGTQNTILDTSPAISGRIGQTLGSASGMQVFAGLRDDPFFIDLEQFFRILPDRKPATGDLSKLPAAPSASAFRKPGIDFLKSINTLAIVIELPESQLTTGGTAKLGIWGTSGR